MGRKNHCLRNDVNPTKPNPTDLLPPLQGGRFVPVIQGLKPLAESSSPFGTRTNRGLGKVRQFPKIEIFSLDFGLRLQPVPIPVSRLRATLIDQNL